MAREIYQDPFYSLLEMFQQSDLILKISSRQWHSKRVVKPLKFFREPYHKVQKPTSFGASLSFAPTA